MINEHKKGTWLGSSYHNSLGIDFEYSIKNRTFAMNSEARFAEELPRLEQCCNALYGGHPIESKSAQDLLLPLAEDVANIPQIQYVLANSTQVNALIFASSGLRKLITTSWAQVPQIQRDGLKEFLFATEGIFYKDNK